MTENHSGSYTVRNEKTVTHWPKPDRDGPGEVVGKDSDGNELKRYPVPEGFKARHSRNESGGIQSENYVKLDDRDEVKRDPHGNAVAIVEGSLAVEHEDGRWELITDNAQVEAFLKKHDKKGGPGQADKPADKPETPQQQDVPQHEHPLQEV